MLLCRWRRFNGKSCFIHLEYNCWRSGFVSLSIHQSSYLLITQSIIITYTVFFCIVRFRYADCFIFIIFFNVLFSGKFMLYYFIYHFKTVFFVLSKSNLAFFSLGRRRPTGSLKPALDVGEHCGECCGEAISQESMMASICWKNFLTTMLWPTWRAGISRSQYTRIHSEAC